MPQIQYKREEGVLHIGGGRFFYAQKPVTVSDEEAKELLGTYKTLEEVKENDADSKADQVPGEDQLPKDPQVPPAGGLDNLYTESGLKKLNAPELDAIITDLNGDPSTVKNSGERIELILKLQSEAEDAGE